MKNINFICIQITLLCYILGDVYGAKKLLQIGLTIEIQSTCTYERQQKTVACVFFFWNVFNFIFFVERKKFIMIIIRC